LSLRFGTGTYRVRNSRKVVSEIRYGYLKSKKTGGALSLKFGTGAYPLKIRRNFVSEIRYVYLPSKKQEKHMKFDTGTYRVSITNVVATPACFSTFCMLIVKDTKQHGLVMYVYSSQHLSLWTFL
jgi:hypothetical protein